tara:strand:+ start:1087 stop:1428 length:342 start_codon:yes stop_codon:yes gene_type:complete
MTLTITNSERDGNLCAISVTSSSSGGNATTDVDVVGKITQVAVTLASGIAGGGTLTLEDTSNNMQLLSAAVNTSDLGTSDINGGSGAYCRGPLKVTMGATLAIRNMKIYYEKF